MFPPLQSWQRAAAQAVYAYCRRAPWRKGKWRLASTAAKQLDLPALLVPGPDGQPFWVDWRADSGWDTMVTEGTYEAGTCALLAEVLRPGDTVFDVGANIGWYSRHLSRIVGPNRCHAFEPHPDFLPWLQANVAMGGVPVTVNATALGAAPGELALHTFSGLPRGHASASTLGRDDFNTLKVPMTTLDAYVAAHDLQEVVCLKVDVEGGEMAVLTGAVSLLNQPLPPMWLLEMNDDTAGHAGYRPADMVRWLDAKHAHCWFRVIGAAGATVPMRDADDYLPGDNVLGVPLGRMDRLPARLQGD
jgi:FkbM family methyltransferase